MDSPNPSCEIGEKRGEKIKRRGGEERGEDSHSFEMRVEASFNALETLTNDHLREGK
jgi:hypothetical protein